MRHSKGCRIVRRQITSRRMAAARRFLRREREQAPLFAAEIAAGQPTPEERITSHDAGSAIHQQHMRDHDARNWRRARARLRAAPQEKALAVLQEWQYGSLPGCPAYLLDLILIRITRGEPQHPFSRRLVDEWLAGSRDGGNHAGRRILLWP